MNKRRDKELRQAIRAAMFCILVAPWCIAVSIIRLVVWMVRSTPLPYAAVAAVREPFAVEPAGDYSADAGACDPMPSILPPVAVPAEPVAVTEPRYRKQGKRYVEDAAGEYRRTFRGKSVRYQLEIAG